MKVWVQFILIYALFIFLIGCQNKLELDSKAPDFVLKDLYNRPVSLKDYRGKLVILDFWATWCYACRMSIPELIKLQKTYQKKGLFVISISLDNPEYMSNKDLLRFKKMLGINYVILRSNAEVIRSYFKGQRLALPTMFVINRDGRIKAKIVGFNPVALRNIVKELLR